MLQITDVQGRRVLAAERLATLRSDADAPARDGRRGVRRRLGALLITAGARLAPGEARGPATRAHRV